MALSYSTSTKEEGKKKKKTCWQAPMKASPPPLLLQTCVSLKCVRYFLTPSNNTQVKRLFYTVVVPNQKKRLQKKKEQLYSMIQL